MHVKPCKDCVAEGRIEGVPQHKWRVASWPGPRCWTHHRAKEKADKLRTHAKHVERTFSISGDDYWFLYEAQGGLCFVCRKAKGIARRLAVDHEHGLCDDHPPDKGCPRCIRALLCSRCNDLIGWLSPEALFRAVAVLTRPPARKLLAERQAKSEYL
ncbi:endonuclease VII [Mycobacterium phage Phrappuccino]|uniref:Endonuclease VII n=1 Tax=Mycobacterium phage Phrappuccino TaxID=2591223 RepID=A0A514DDW9_9CAUD|nr:endonuclease VII [Mycobacterium phage Phrappuccino]QDH91802.1 endonuclease VII [Mycobacterium phage Phrappuccino]QIQ63244.1 endonuclease VII [Mycobacterium phage Settecandela]